MTDKTILLKRPLYRTGELFVKVQEKKVEVIYTGKQLLMDVLKMARSRLKELLKMVRRDGLWTFWNEKGIKRVENEFKRGQQNTFMRMVREGSIKDNKSDGYGCIGKNGLKRSGSKLEEWQDRWSICRMA